MPVECRNDQKRARLNTRRFKKWGEVLLKAVDRSESTLSLWLTDDRQMARLHQRWMGDPDPTDVLSFSQEGGPRDLLGDVVISVDTAARNSPGDVEKEIVRCLIHGVLHLVGYDHARREERRRMEKESRRLKRFLDAHV